MESCSKALLQLPRIFPDMNHADIEFIKHFFVGLHGGRQADPIRGESTHPAALLSVFGTGGVSKAFHGTNNRDTIAGQRVHLPGEDNQLIQGDFWLEEFESL